MDSLILLSNAISSGAGAFFGAMAAYLLACRQENQHRIAVYLSSLLMIHEQIFPLYSLFSKIPPERVKEIEGEKSVIFDLPFPNFSLTPQQIQLLFELSPDKKMPSALMQMQNFLNVCAQRLVVDGANILPIEEIKEYERQLKSMLLSLEVQYEQQSKSDFPLKCAVPHTPLQMKQ